MIFETNRPFIDRDKRGWLDLTGAAASWLCAVHCLLFPLLITLLPIAGLTLLLDETIERVFVGVSAGLAALSLLPGYFKYHKKLRTLLFAVSGISLIALTHYRFEDDFIVKSILLVTGAAFLSAAHMMNRRLCRDCVICTTASNAEPVRGGVRDN